MAFDAGTPILRWKYRIRYGRSRDLRSLAINIALRIVGGCAGSVARLITAARPSDCPCGQIAWRAAATYSAAFPMQGLWIAVGTLRILTIYIILSYKFYRLSWFSKERFRELQSSRSKQFFVLK